MANKAPGRSEPAMSTSRRIPGAVPWRNSPEPDRTSVNPNMQLSIGRSSGYLDSVLVAIGIFRRERIAVHRHRFNHCRRWQICGRQTVNISVGRDWSCSGDLLRISREFGWVIRNFAKFVSRKRSRLKGGLVGAGLDVNGFSDDCKRQRDFEKRRLVAEYSLIWRKSILDNR